MIIMNETEEKKKKSFSLFFPSKIISGKFCCCSRLFYIRFSNLKNWKNFFLFNSNDNYYSAVCHHHNRNEWMNEKNWNFFLFFSHTHNCISNQEKKRKLTVSNRRKEEILRFFTWFYLPDFSFLIYSSFKQ